MPPFWYPEIMSPEDLLLEAWPYFHMTPDERDRLIHSVCGTAMRQWLSLPEDRRLRWPPEPGPQGEEILRRWAEEFRDRNSPRSRR